MRRNGSPKRHKVKVLPPGKALLQIYKITRKRLNSRKRENETYDDLVARLVDEYPANTD